MKYICEHCRNQVTDSQKYCHECGSQLEQLNDADKKKVKDEDSFRDYAHNLYQEAHGDDYDYEKADETIEYVIKKYKDENDDEITTWEEAIAFVQQTVAS